MARLTGWLIVAAVLAGACPAAPGQVSVEDLAAFDPTAGPPSATEKLSARTIPSLKTARPGDSLTMAVEMTLEESFYIYGPAPGGKTQVLPTEVAVGETPLKTGEVLFAPTVPHAIKTPDGAPDSYMVYEDKGWFFVPLIVPEGLTEGAYDVPIAITGQVCSAELCLQLDTTVLATVVVAATSEKSPTWTAEMGAALAKSKTAEQWRAIAEAEKIDWGAPPTLRFGTLAAFGLALLAGLILNVMPCVLPVVPLKVLSLVNQSRASPVRFRTLGLAFAGGMVLFFAGLAAASAALKLAIGYRLGWGDLFGFPSFIYGLALVLVAFAMNLFGAFAVTVPEAVAQAEGRRREGHLGAVGTGFLTAVLSTPCSFAFLGTAFLWAQTQPIWLGTLGILAIGAGMAAPYVAMSFFPGLVSRIPKAGRWTDMLKQSVGFILLMVTVWLMSTQMQDKRTAWAIAYAVVLAACLWAWGSWVRFDAPPARKLLVRGGAVVVAVAAGVWMLPAPKPLAVEFEPFSADRIAAAHAEGRVVLIDFTASWCLTCKTVERIVYDNERVARELRDRGVVAIQADVTRRDSPAARMLRDTLGEAGVPVTVIVPPGSAPPIRLHGVFTPSDLLEALDRAAGAWAP